jgi:hypothetical protein
MSIHFCGRVFSSLPCLVELSVECLAGPPGPAGAREFMHPTGPCRHLGHARKCLVQTGLDFESPFKTVRFRASSKPDWPDF